MDNQLNCLPIQQACESAPKIQAQVEEKEQMTEEQRESALRFKSLSVGCFLYALFFTFCLYQNKSGITYPFFVGGTLYFFYSYSKRFGATAAKDRRFLMTAMLLLGIINATTDSGVLIFLNRIMIVFLFGVLVLESFHDCIGWKLWVWIKTLTYLVCGSMSKLFQPFGDFGQFWKLREKTMEQTPERKARNQRLRYGGIGVCLSIPVLFFICLQLGSADPLFYEMLCNVWDVFASWSLPEFLKSEDFMGVLCMIIGSFLGMYGLLIYSGKRQYIEKASKTVAVEWDAYIAVTFLSMFAIVYCLFCGIQIFGLFLGRMTLPEGYTYAGYARQGFFQLLFVCLFNIGLVLFCLGFFKKNKWLKGMLTLISGCTYIMTASSAYRMILYISSYQLTFLRVFVLWSLLMIAFVLAGILLYIRNQNFGLFRYLLLTVAVGSIVFSAAHPDYWIAKYNINQFVQQEKDIDPWYLTTNLSLDAAPVVYELQTADYAQKWDSRVADILNRYDLRIAEKTEDMHIRSWNASRAYAKFLYKVE